LLVLIAIATALFTGCQSTPTDSLSVQKGSRILLIGNNLGSRMMNYGHFETEMQVRYPDSMLYIRNMCDGGNTPGFRPHAGRSTPWAFPGAEQFQTELATNSHSEGNFESPDEWLSRDKADIIIAFFGFNESFQGEEGLDNYKAELEAFINHTLSQRYNGIAPPQLAIVSPIAFEDLSDQYDLPDGKKENANLLMYTRAMQEIALKYKIVFADAYHPSLKWFTAAKEPLTIDGSQLNEEGYKKFAVLDIKNSRSCWLMRSLERLPSKRKPTGRLSWKR